LDTKRFHQVQQRLERQVEFAVEEAKEAKVMMDELRETSERHLEQMRDARLDAQEELRDCQLQLEEERAIAATTDLEEHPKVARLESEVEGLSTENDGLRETIDELKEGMRQRVVAEKEHQTTFKQRRRTRG
jgi:hypothetical protein